MPKFYAHMENRAIEPDSALSHTFAILSWAKGTSEEDFSFPIKLVNFFLKNYLNTVEIHEGTIVATTVVGGSQLTKL